MGALWIIAAALLWCAVGPLSRVALEAGLGPLEVALGRALVAWCGFAVHVTWRGGALPRRRDLPELVVFAVFGVALLFAMNQLAVRAGGAALATVLLYTAPIWVAALAPIARGERRPVTAALVAAGGIALVSFGGGGAVRVTPAALGWGLGSGAAYALYSVLGKRLLRQSSPQGLFLCALPVACVALVAFGAAPHGMPTARQAIVVGIIGALSFAASLCFARGLATTWAAQAALLATIEPIGAAVIAAAAFGERLGTWGTIGAATVVGAALASARPERRITSRDGAAPRP
jgi:drug/metabolite transporter (DMT)-like permease